MSHSHSVQQPKQPTIQNIAGGDAAMKKGAEGKHVEHVQRLLNRRLDGADLKVDGQFGPMTEKAVERFQRKHDLKVTGRVDHETLEKLEGKRVHHKDELVTRGDEGKQVLGIERNLKRLGYDPGDVDGTYDKDTAKAVAKFKHDENVKREHGGSMSGAEQRMLRRELRRLDHDPYREREKPSKQHRRLDAATAEAAKQKHVVPGAVDGPFGLDLPGVAEGIGPETKNKRVIKNVQSHLRSAGFAPKNQDGVWDERTETAVKAFQRKSGIEPATGRVDADTWRKLQRAQFEGKTATSPAQREGEHGGEVKRTEKLLQTAGFLKKREVDGLYDADTAKAVEKLERRAKRDVDGDLNGGDLKALEKIVRTMKPRRVPKPDVVHAPSPNQSSRGGTDIDTIVLHHTASNNGKGDLATLRSPASEVSAHYMIDKDGTIYQLVDDSRRAGHAGEGALPGQGPSDINDRSLGIEIVNAGDGRTPFTKAQYRALEQLVPHLAQKYRVPMKNIVGHRDVAPGRKVDPADNFDWSRVRDAVRRAI